MNGHFFTTILQSLQLRYYVLDRKLDNYTVYNDIKYCEEQEDGTFEDLAQLIANKIVFEDDSCVTSDIKEVSIAKKTFEDK